MRKILGMILSNTVQDPWRRYQKKKPKWRVWRKKKEYPKPVEETQRQPVKAVLRRSIEEKEREERDAESMKKRSDEERAKRLKRGNTRYGGRA